LGCPSLGGTWVSESEVAELGAGAEVSRLDITVMVVLALSMSPVRGKKKDKERSVDPKKETASWAAAPIADVSAKDSLFRNRACSAPKEPIGAPAMVYYVRRCR
jgi:hypothetical protein